MKAAMTEHSIPAAAVQRFIRAAFESQLHRQAIDELQRAGRSARRVLTVPWVRGLLPRIALITNSAAD